MSDNAAFVLVILIVCGAMVLAAWLGSRKP